MKRILIVDDQAEIRELLEMVFEGGDLSVIMASNATEALDMAMTFQPHLVLMDVMMPGPMNGIEACRQLKSDPRYGQPRVVMLSAMAQQKDFDRGDAAGADAYITKPFSPAMVESTVDLMLGRSTA